MNTQITDFGQRAGRVLNEDNDEIRDIRLRKLFTRFRKTRALNQIGKVLAEHSIVAVLDKLIPDVYPLPGYRDIPVGRGSPYQNAEGNLLLFLYLFFNSPVEIFPPLFCSLRLWL